MVSLVFSMDKVVAIHDLEWEDEVSMFWSSETRVVLMGGATAMMINALGRACLDPG